MTDAHAQESQIRNVNQCITWQRKVCSLSEGIDSFAYRRRLEDCAFVFSVRVDVSGFYRYMRDSLLFTSFQGSLQLF